MGRRWDGNDNVEIMSSECRTACDNASHEMWCRKRDERQRIDGRLHLRLRGAVAPPLPTVVLILQHGEGDGLSEAYPCQEVGTNDHGDISDVGRVESSVTFGAENAARIVQRLS